MLRKTRVRPHEREYRERRAANIWLRFIGFPPLRQFACCSFQDLRLDPLRWSSDVGAHPE